MLRTFTNGTIEYFIDPIRRLIFTRWEGDVRGEELLKASPELWRQYPEVGRWDAIHDMMDFTGLLEHRHTRALMQLRAELVLDFNPNVRTAVVSGDRMKTFEIKVTKVTAPDRQFQLFESNAAALDWMSAGTHRAAPDPAGAPLPWWFERKSAAKPEPVR